MADTDIGNAAFDGGGGTGKKAFHPADPAHGSKNYDLEALEPRQQEILNKRKITQRKQNEMYLREHPEITGLVSIILRHLLNKKPDTVLELQELVSTFFQRRRGVIAAELLDCLQEMECKHRIMDELSREARANEEA